MSNLLIVTCTKAKTLEEFATRPVYNGLQEYVDAGKADFYVFKDNQKGLSQCYNEIIQDPKNFSKTVLFVHDDVELQDLFLVEKLLTSPYSITGIAGTKAFDKTFPKSAWHLASKQTDWVGEAGHVNKEGKVWTTVFGPTNSRALIVDGLFISCKVMDLIEKELYFDETFGFHFYDMAFCLKANEKRVSCGVLPIHVVHHGLGDSMITPEWEEANNKFREVYCK